MCSQCLTEERKYDIEMRMDCYSESYLPKTKQNIKTYGIFVKNSAE